MNKQLSDFWMFRMQSSATSCHWPYLKLTDRESSQLFVPPCFTRTLIYNCTNMFALAVLDLYYKAKALLVAIH